MLAPLLLSLAVGDIHLVDFEGVNGFATLQAAVDAAVSGDTLLLRLRHGSLLYRQAGAEVRGKGLTIIGLKVRALDPPLRLEPIRVVDLPAGETVVLRGLDAERGAGSAASPALEVRDSLGAVRVEGCKFSTRLDGAVGQPATVELSAALDVSFFDSDIAGTPSGSLRARRSRVALYESRLVGAAGEPGVSYTISQAADGHPSLVLEERSFAWLGATLVQGGDGGYAECIHNVTCTALSGNGGVGASIEAGSLCVELESSIRGGDPGNLWWSADPTTSMVGQPGPDVFGATLTVPGSQRRLSAPRSVRAGDAVEVTLKGSPGEEVVIVGTVAGGHRFLGPLHGVLLANGGAILAPTTLGVIPASGVLEATVDLGPLAPDDARTVQLQAILRTSPTRFRTTPVRAVTQLGANLRPLEPVARVYMDSAAPPGGDGSSWQNAASDLTELFSWLPVGGAQPTEVWMREGVYLAAQPSDPTPSAAQYFDKLHLLGGFNGTETSAEARDPKLHPVVISGDIAGDDALGGSRVDNARGLLTLGVDAGPERETRLSGITFEGSHNGTAVLINGALLAERCRFRDNNSGSNGAAALTASTSPQSAERFRVHSSSFERNLGGFGGGLLLYAWTSSSLASGIPFETPRAEVVGCVFYGNRATGSRYAPAISAYAQRGGAIDVVARLDLVEVLGCTFVDNHSWATSYLRAAPGGVAFERPGRLRFMNNLCVSPYIAAHPSLLFTELGSAAGSEAAYNRVELLPPGWDPATHTTALPGFVDALGPDGLHATGDEDYRLGASSPCADAGDSTRVPAWLQTDLDGLPRFVDDPTAANVGVGGTRIVDMGAYERQ